MALSIRNPAELAGALAALTGEAMTEAVTKALRDRLARIRRERSRRRPADELDTIARHCASLRLSWRSCRTSPNAVASSEALEAAEARHLSTATFVETSVVIEARYGHAGLRDLDALLARAAIELVPVDAEQAELARSAFSRFGRGRHPAGLNYGDCFSYALAQALGEPLLCKGGDFAQTDVAAFPAEA